ncbi:hypothetical protein CP061683_1158C, partial [Chlamydia psittaci 06-1683]
KLRKHVSIPNREKKKKVREKKDNKNIKSKSNIIINRKKALLLKSFLIKHLFVIRNLVCYLMRLLNSPLQRLS